MVEAYHKLPQNFRRHQRKFPGNFLKTSSGPAAVSRKFPRNFLAGVLTLGLLILTSWAKVYHSGKPNFYFEVKIFTLRIDFEGKAKTGEVKIFSFGFEVNFLTCLVYWVHESIDTPEAYYVPTRPRPSQPASSASPASPASPASLASRRPRRPQRPLRRPSRRPRRPQRP